VTWHRRLSSRYCLQSRHCCKARQRFPCAKGYATSSVHSRYILGSSAQRDLPCCEYINPARWTSKKPDCCYCYLARERKKRQLRRWEQKQAVLASQVKYPGGPKAEQLRLLKLLRNASRAQIVEFARSYGSSAEFLERNWLYKAENSRKAKPGDIVFETNNTIQPYIFVASVRYNSSSSMRWLFGRNGQLYKRTNIRRWDEEPMFLEERQAAINEWN